MGRELGDSVIDRERAIMVFMLWLVVLSLLGACDGSYNNHDACEVEVPWNIGFQCWILMMQFQMLKRRINGLGLENN